MPASMLETTRAVDSSALEGSLDLQIAVLREKQADTSALAQRIEEAKALLAQLEREHTESIRKQGILTETIAIYEDMIRLKKGAPTMPQPLSAGQAERASHPSHDQGEPRLVARIGDQHYRMLRAIESNNSLPMPEIAMASFVSLRRARVQINEDFERGIVALIDGRYALTTKGVDYVRRFEEFRQSSDIPLPSLDPDRSEQGNEAAGTGRAWDTEIQTAEGDAG
jgi:hypothetical protein